MRIITLPGVFTPRSDTWLLADVMRRAQPPRDADVLELGTGSGAIGVAAAQSGARSVTVVDVSRRALVTAAINARLNGVRVIPRRGDLFGPVAGEQFDLVVSNPPYLPSDEIPKRGAARAWEGGGTDGRGLLERICSDVAGHLRPGGTVLLVHSSVNDVSRTLGALERAGLKADVLAREAGPTGPLLSAKLPGLDEEEIYVVGGRRVQGRSRSRSTRGVGPPIVDPSSRAWRRADAETTSCMGTARVREEVSPWTFSRSS